MIEKFEICDQLMFPLEKQLNNPDRTMQTTTKTPQELKELFELENLKELEELWATGYPTIIRRIGEKITEVNVLAKSIGTSKAIDSAVSMANLFPILKKALDALHLSLQKTGHPTPQCQDGGIGPKWWSDVFPSLKNQEVKAWAEPLNEIRMCGFRGACAFLGSYVDGPGDTCIRVSPTDHMSEEGKEQVKKLT